MRVDLAEEGYLLFAVGQLGHAAFGQTDLAHEAHVQQSGEKLSGVALLLRRGKTQLYCGGTTADSAGTFDCGGCAPLPPSSPGSGNGMTASSLMT